ncbi:hypothetical protein FRB99_005358 [Tulasnella sp. 403]|nr:hypothetical protein FRB99_005358 [Tulasnella sp. 403]
MLSLLSPFSLRVTDLRQPLALFKRFYDALGSVITLPRRQNGATLAQGPITKAFICSLGYSTCDAQSLDGPKNDLPHVLEYIAFDHKDPRFEVVTDYKWEFTGIEVDAQPQLTTSNQIIRHLKDFISNLKDNDKAFIYFAGHAYLIGEGASQYQVLVATDSDYNASLIHASVLEDAIFSSLESRAALVRGFLNRKIAFDACHSEDIISLSMEERAAKKGSGKPMDNEIILIAGAQRDRPSFSKRIDQSKPGDFRGVMTYHLLNYLREYPTAEVKGLRMHLERECMAATQDDDKGPQKPVISLSLPSIKRFTLR